MFEIKKLKGNTYYFEAFSNIGIFARDGVNAVLIDSCDHPRMVKSVDKQLTEMGMTVDAVINTHCHVDHICGNSFFKEKYGCKLLSTKKEQSFIAFPSLEPEFYYSGIDIKNSRNPFFATEPSEAELLTAENTPAGTEIISLPGHAFDMIGVITEDSVAFLADAVLSKRTWDEYRFPFFYDVNSSIATLEKLRSLEADIYVPSHDAPTESITELADYNIERLREKKELIFDICKGKGFDAVFEEAMRREKLQLRTEKYAMYAVMIRNLLHSLIVDGRIKAVLENNRLIYVIV